MEQRIKEYVDELFKDAPKNRQAQEYKEEILRSTLERAADMLEEGRDEDESFRLAAAGIGDINEYFDALNEAKPRKIKKTAKWIRTALISLAVVYTLAFTIFTAVSVIGGRFDPDRIFTTFPDIEELPLGSGIELDAGISKLSLSVPGSSVKLCEGTEKLTVSCSAPEGYSYYTDGTTAVISRSEDYIDVGLNGTDLITVAVPEGLALSVTVSASSGDIEAEGIRLEEFTAETSSGSIRAEGLSCLSLNMKTSSGSISTENTQVGEDVLARSSSGSIRLMIASCYGVSAGTSSGSITVNAPGASRGELNSSSGSITLYSVRGMYLKPGDLSDFSFEKEYTLEPDGTVFFGDKPTIPFTVTSSLGDIVIK